MVIMLLFLKKQKRKMAKSAKRGKDNHSSKKVLGPNGEIYDSIKIACDLNNIAYTTMRYWLSGRTKKESWMVLL